MNQDRSKATRPEQLLRDERGEDLIEYALLTAFAAGVVLVALLGNSGSVKSALVGAFQQVRTALGSVL